MTKEYRMFYTILGMVIFGSLTYVLCKLNDVSFRSSGCVPSEGSVFTILGVLVGAGLGFGYGLHALTTGTHSVVNLFRN